MKKYLITLLILLGYPFFKAYTQEKTITIDHLTSENGLSDNQVTCVLRDPLGFVWIGTKDGLNRYDGREFYVFKHNGNDSSSICGNSISCLELDSDSLLWIGTTSSGFCSYDFRNGKFKSYAKSNLPLLSNSINDIAFDKSRNCLWLALNNNGLFLFDLKTKRLRNNQKAISINTYYDVEIYDTIPYFAGINESLKRIGKLGKNRTYICDTAFTINKIFLTDDNKIWCGAWDNGLHEFDANTKRLNTYFLDGTVNLNQSGGNEIISLAVDENHVLWCGTKTTGILFFDLKTRKFAKKFAFSQPVTSRINCIYRDDFNRMWIGTETGLFVYNPLHNQFETIKLPVPENTLRCKVYDRLITVSGKEFIVAECGLFYKYPDKGVYQFKEFKYRNEKLQLHSIFSDHKNRIYIGSNKTLFILDTNSLQLSLVKCNKICTIEPTSSGFFSIPSSRVNNIIQIEHRNDFLIATSFYGYAVFAFHPEKENIFCLYQDTSAHKNGPIENLTRKLFVDSKNKFWVCGASKGISQFYIPNSVSFDAFNFSDTLIRIIYIAQKNWANTKFGNITDINDVFDITENRDGSYWLSTQGNGLLKFIPENDSTPFASFANNFKSLQGIIKTDENNLWIISSVGLLNYNIKANRYKLYDKTNGIIENIGGYFFQNNKQNSRNFLNAGFDGGFISFNPKEIIADAEKPKVKITRLWIMDSPSDSLLFDPLKLEHNQNFLKFYISSNSFSTNEQTTFMYLLEGIDNTWRNNQNNPLITYTNLPHGYYTLKVKAINSTGMESDEIDLPIIITPPFYRTIYFYLFVLFILSGALYVFYRYRIKQILKLQEVRNKIARDLHDDIGSTLGSIHLYSQIANKKLGDDKRDEIKSILEKIENSSGEIIDRTGDAVWAVKASNDTLKSLILRMESYAASLLGDLGVQFSIDYDETLINKKLDMTHRKNLFLIYKEAIHNIIKYAKCTGVEIKILKSGDHIQFSISDNGTGFTTNHMNPYNGNGIKNMKARAEEINGSFTIASQSGCGTVIKIII